MLSLLYLIQCCNVWNFILKLSVSSNREPHEPHERADALLVRMTNESRKILCDTPYLPSDIFRWCHVFRKDIPSAQSVHVPSTCHHPLVNLDSDWIISPSKLSSPFPDYFQIALCIFTEPVSIVLVPFWEELYYSSLEHKLLEGRDLAVFTPTLYPGCLITFICAS